MVRLSIAARAGDIVNDAGAGGKRSGSSEERGAIKLPPLPPRRGRGRWDGVALWLSVWFGCGYAPKAPGTVGALGALPVFAVAQLAGPFTVFAVGALVTVVGIWSSTRVARQMRVEDPQIIVIDEVAGVLLTLAVAPPGWLGLAAGFLLFRAFDIWKPWPVRLFERLPLGFGIMMDDVAAAAMAAAVLLVPQMLKVWP
ncbi:MAG: phosphatidylglycerophosphatase A [Deltaproteobacteria bacterium]|nr:phosphatidylglycerophosphatase A [Deltaproteobacteria bacterium]